MSYENLHLQFCLLLDARDTGNAARKEEFLNEMVGAARCPRGYPEYLERLTSTLGQYRDFVATAKLAIGLGNECVLGVGLTLNRLWGVPMIHGSAVKGLVLREAIEQLGLRGHLPKDPKPFPWHKIGDSEKAAQMQRLFGDVEGEGGLTFHDALWVPDQKPFLKRDIVTRHNKSYYEGEGQPTDMDSPVPVGYLVVPKGEVFRFWIEGEWADLGYTLLESALKNLGIGGKTSSGYGRMKPQQGAVVTR